eukprot:202134_1
MNNTKIKSSLNKGIYDRISTIFSFNHLIQKITTTLKTQHPLSTNMKYTLLPLIAQLVIHSSEATKTILGGCTYNEFQCNNGECVSDEYMCSTDTPTTTWTGLNKLVCDGVVYVLYCTIIQQPAGECEQNTGSMRRCDSFGSLS